MTLIESLNQIAAMQGKEPIDPTRVMDNHDDGPPPEARIPEYGPPAPEEAYDDPEPEPTPPPRPVAIRPFPTAPEAQLVLLDRKASFRGQDIELSEAEGAAISSIVLRAIQRRITDQLAEIRAIMPKQVRVRRKRKAKASG